MRGLTMHARPLIRLDIHFKLPQETLLMRACAPTAVIAPRTPGHSHDTFEPFFAMLLVDQAFISPGAR